MNKQQRRVEEGARRALDSERAILEPARGDIEADSYAQQGQLEGYTKEETGDITITT